jgi:hypothetical protein
MDDKLSEYRPTITDENGFYWEGTKNGELLLQRCQSCTALRHPPSPACPHCLSLDWTPEPAPTRGTLYSVASPQHPPAPMHGSGFLTCLVELEGGIRVMTNLLDCSLGDAKITMPVELFFEPLADGYQLPQFRPVGQV